MISTAVMIKLGKVYEPYGRPQPTNEKLMDRAIGLLCMRRALNGKAEEVLKLQAELENGNHYRKTGVNLEFAKVTGAG